ncbi:alpha-L-fucosidase [Posidoniimonas polymericola]|uniref:alpha-L-fucosidase n=1 Tax=Posidoniimonas polymericola TaxID=2528002 RepID=UPI0018D368A8|nr:alpha-L-fucosidase [Posidoniimonas polymericola]
MRRILQNLGLAIVCWAAVGIASAEVDVDSFPVEHLDFSIAEGPFEPTWESIAEQHPGAAPWFRDAKVGIWIHWGPQAAGEAGDWYAKKMYLEDDSAAAKHRERFGHPSEFGYKDVLNQWRTPDFDADALMTRFHDAGFRYAIIMGVHHDNFDLWDSRHQPWNSTRVGPRRNFLKEWLTAAKRHGVRSGVSFHHEYTWWWWQPAFGADSSGPMAGVPYDGLLTAADGKAKWWDGLDPRDLYGSPLQGYPQYEPVHLIAHGRQGIFDHHLDYAREYATKWAARIMDVVDRYDVDFIYTDGNSTQPFSGKRSGSGYKCDAAQRVVAHYFNRTLERRGKVDAFAVVKFSKPQNGLASTSESRIGGGINTERMWMGERAVGSWFYAPGFVYDCKSAVQSLLEYASRDGNFALSVPITPSGGLTPDAVEMLEGFGRWMKINGRGIYGSTAWRVFSEGTGKLPGGAIGARTADYQFSNEDFRFTVGADGALYVWCMATPESGATLLVRSLASSSANAKETIESVELLGSELEVVWERLEEGLRITCPDMSALRHAVGFRVVLE